MVDSPDAPGDDPCTVTGIRAINEPGEGLVELGITVGSRVWARRNLLAQAAHEVIVALPRAVAIPAGDEPAAQFVRRPCVSNLWTRCGPGTHADRDPGSQ